MRCLREVNVDNNTVGWYQSSNHGSYQTTEMIETFVSYHESIRKVRAGGRAGDCAGDGSDGGGVGRGEGREEGREEGRAAGAAPRRPGRCGGPRRLQPLTLPPLAPAAPLHNPTPAAPDPAAPRTCCPAPQPLPPPHPQCVCLVYDPQLSSRGQLALKAVRLKDSFIEHFKEQKLTGGCQRGAAVAFGARAAGRTTCTASGRTAVRRRPRTRSWRLGT
jgi:hypothetical protein